VNAASSSAGVGTAGSNRTSAGSFGVCESSVPPDRRGGCWRPFLRPTRYAPSWSRGRPKGRCWWSSRLFRPSVHCLPQRSCRGSKRRLRLSRSATKVVFACVRRMNGLESALIDTRSVTGTENSGPPPAPDSRAPARSPAVSAVARAPETGTRHRRHLTTRTTWSIIVHRRGGQVLLATNGVKLRKLRVKLTLELLMETEQLDWSADQSRRRLATSHQRWFRSGRGVNGVRWPKQYDASTDPAKGAFIFSQERVPSPSTSSPQQALCCTPGTSSLVATATCTLGETATGVVLLAQSATPVHVGRVSSSVGILHLRPSVRGLGGLASESF
jgi:hypothetical protein